jgi:hypothetical protein
MADGTTWRGRPITLGEFLLGGGILFAVCSSPGCGAATEVEPRLVENAWRSSVPRLEDALRCTCGARGGTLVVAGPGARRPLGASRCFLFHA